ncbi:MAG: HAMP domain-containing sensor histidine kinase [Clostridia bacterium]|nr:HAMP domain-containing sensor histidine kinase [Clostridia bacterium]
MDLRSMEFAHDMKMPIQLIYSCVQLLEMELAPNARTEGYLQTLMQSAGQLQSMVERALDGEELRLELRDVVADTRDVCRQCALFARGRGIEIRFSSNVPALRMLTDVEKLRRMLHNLISNALRFTPEGGRVEVACAASAEEVELRVIDSGSGIAPELHERIFETGVTDGGHGYGLGIVQSYARLLGGDISVKSAPGAGSCFILRLPIRHAASQIN